MVKTLRFGPLPSKTITVKRQHPDGTSYDSIETPPRSEWDKFIDIPPDTRVRVIAMPGSQAIFDGAATRSWSRDLDPGKYRYMMSTNLERGEEENARYRCVRVEGEFLIDLTEAQFQRLQTAVPRFSSPIQTSDGPKWVCKRCKRRTDNKIAAFLHESRDHFNIDPIKEPERMMEVELKGAEVVADLRKEAKDAGKVSNKDILKGLSQSGE